MTDYNSQILDDYFKKRDYLGAADYLSTLKASSNENQIILENKIRELRLQGEKQKGLLQNMSTEGQQAYNFISAIDGNGNLPEDNSFSFNFKNLINDLKVIKDTMSPGGRNVKGENIKTININFSKDEYYKEYLNNLGISNDKELQSLGLNVKQDSNTGYWTVSIPTTDLKASKYLNATNNITLNGGGYSAPIDASGIILPYYINGVTTSNIIVNENEFNLSNLRHAGDIIKDARNLQDEELKDNETISLQEDIVVTPFLGHGHANAYKRMVSGAISMDDYKKIVEERTNTYNNLLTHVDFSNYDVYAAYINDDDEENRIFNEVKAQDKASLMEYLLVAMGEKDRISYAAAEKSGELGTYITIKPSTKEKEEQFKKGVRIFVPGLFKSSCDESFNSDTKQMSVRQDADMKRWNYGKFLKNGKYVGYDKEIGAYELITDENGEQVKSPITTDDILRELNEENIINQSVTKLASVINDDGTPMTYIKNGKTLTYNIEETAKTLANVATNEIYPKGQYKDSKRVLKANNIYNAIMSELYAKFYKQDEE